jgi:sortase A
MPGGGTCDTAARLSRTSEEGMPVNTPVDEPDRTPRRRWGFSWIPVVASLVILAGTGVFLYPQAASWFSQREQSRVTEMAQQRLQEPPNDDALFRAEQLQRAHAYNEALASGALLEANANVPTGDGTSSDESLSYKEILDSTGLGLMGRLRYDALAIDLPVYHGTSDETLLRGVGHLEGTSFPVGGVGTRSVLTAHRGLASSTLFSDLDKAKTGDTFTISVLDQVLAYRVVSTQVIEPGETEAIRADPERDLVTLVTCTPLGINTHRILVTAERVTPTPPRRRRHPRSLDSRGGPSSSAGS